MESLSDNIILHNIFPYIDFVLLPEIIVLRGINKRLNRLVISYYQYQLTNPTSILSSPENFNEILKYDISQLFKSCKITYELFENEMVEAYELINKQSVGALIDHVSQSNQNNVEKEVLKVLDILVYLFEFKFKSAYLSTEEKKCKLNTSVKRSKTQKKKDKTYKYLELIGDYWEFKNSFRKVKFLHQENSRILKIEKKTQKINKKFIENFDALRGILAYLSVIYKYSEPHFKIQLILCKRFCDTVELTLSDIKLWVQNLVAYMSVI